MRKYQVIIKKWDFESKKQVEEVAGEFNDYMNAKIFAQAYADFYHATAKIQEFRLIGTHEVTPNL